MRALRICLLALVLAAPADAAIGSGPTNHTAPAVIGIARAGQQLNSTTGTWAGQGTVTYTYQWDRCDPLGNGCVVVSSARLPTYTLAAADVGKTIALTVTAKDSAGTSIAAASLLGPIAPASGLASIARPLITGTAAVGSTLTVSAGTWTTTPGSLTFTWLRCTTSGRACSAIAGANAGTHVAGAADAGHALVVRVEAKAGSSTQDVLSLASAVIQAKSTTTTTTTPTASTTTATATTSTTATIATTTTTATTTTPAPASTRPAVIGTAQVGQRLSYAPPESASGSVAFQWYRCDATGAHCASIHGATAAGYRLVAKDSGQTVGLTVKTTPAGGTATPSYSSLVGPIEAATASAASTAQPSVTGTPMQGQTLTATAGTWTKTPGAVAYAWWQCNANGRICSPIAGATSSTYVPVAGDVGHVLAALVTATIGSEKASALSVVTDAIQAPPVLGATSPPAIEGTLEVGQRLTGSTGVWTGSAPITYHYQWYRCDTTGAHCSSVHGATAATYRLTSADSGKTIGLTVTATDATAATTPAYASLAGPVAVASATLASTMQPKLTGSAVVGQTLSIVAGSWSSTPKSTTYAWQRCNANGRICAAIAGATSETYALTSADVGHAVLVVVTVKAGSATASALSASTAVVK